MKAALDEMKHMIARNIALSELGYMISDSGRLAKFKPRKMPDLKRIFLKED